MQKDENLNNCVICYIYIYIYNCIFLPYKTRDDDGDDDDNM